MKLHTTLIAAAAVVAACVVGPAPLYAQGPEAQDHKQHHPEAVAQQQAVPARPADQPRADSTGMMARMKATGEKLDALVKKMNAAQGTAKTDAIAELLTALVEERRSMCEPMMSMMSMMGGAGGHGEATTVPPHK
jgi:uncharacterized protein (DUF2342 family)